MAQMLFPAGKGSARFSLLLAKGTSGLGPDPEPSGPPGARPVNSVDHGSQTQIHSLLQVTAC